jgi:hypothetical protein
LVGRSGDAVIHKAWIGPGNTHLQLTILPSTCTGNDCASFIIAGGLSGFGKLSCTGSAATICKCRGVYLGCKPGISDAVRDAAIANLPFFMDYV